MTYTDEHDEEWVDEEAEFGDSDPADDVLNCPSCGATVYEDTQKCPRCGDWITPVNAHPRRNSIWYILLVFVLIVAFLYFML